MSAESRHQAGRGFGENTEAPERYNGDAPGLLAITVCYYGWWPQAARAMARRGMQEVAPLSEVEAQSKLEPFGGVFDEYSTLVVQVRSGTR